jgi:cbb3-type cytochrome c oxidase subunit III
MLNMMKKLITTLSAVALMAGAVSAQAAGDAEAGKAKTAVCAGCHGADGNSMVPSFPKLAGQVEKYTIKQLHDMKNGDRNVPQMAAFLPGLSDQDIEDIAAYYASQTPKVGKANPELVALGEQIFRAGNPESGVTACAGCHGAAGKGMPAAGFPLLSGQHADYTEAQLKAFRASGRGDEKGPYRANDGDSMMMRATAARLTDSEIKALASYINGLY